MSGSDSEQPSEEFIGIDLTLTSSQRAQQGVSSFDFETSEPELQDDPSEHPDQEDLEPEDQQVLTSDNHSDSSMSEPVDVTTTANKAIFDRDVAISAEEMRKNKIVVSKDKRGEKGSREYGTHYRLATEKLSRSFDAPAQFVPIVREEEDESRTRYKDIQSMYVGNIERLQELKERAERYDLVDIANIPDYRDKNATHPADKWDGVDKRTSLIDSWSQIELQHVCDYQSDINKYSSVDGVSSEWLQDLIYNSSTPELRELVAQKTASLVVDDSQLGGAVMLKITLDQMFCMTQDVVTALQDFLEDFGKNGIIMVVGENVPSIVKKILVVSIRLAEVNQLPSKAVNWVLTGFSLCSVKEFKDPFKLMLDQDAVSNMGKPVGTGEKSSTESLKKIKEYCTKAITTFESLSLAEKWVTAKGGTIASCWNCGGDDHNLRGCKAPKDQAKIDANKKKWEDSREKKPQGGNGGRGGGGYERRQFGGRGNAGRGGNGGRGRGNGGGGLTHNGVSLIAGEWMCLCNKRGADGVPCGWNRTHTTAYHGKWMANPQNYPAHLPGTHPFKKLKNESNGGGGATQGQANKAATPAASNGGASDAKVKAIITQSTSIFESMSKNTADPDMAAHFEKLGALWGSLN